MNFSEYQKAAFSTATETSRNLPYMTLGLTGEAGEVANKVKKIIRDGKELDREDITAELGDCLWYIAGFATVAGISMEEIAGKNLKKLADRKARGVISGSGDNR